MTIDKEILDRLSELAVGSPRLRMNLDMRNSKDDNSQRNFNALEPGTIIPIHRHPNTSETCIIIRGALRSIFYNDNGDIEKDIILDSQRGIYGISIPQGQWHSAEALEAGTVIFEAKDGAYEPLSPEDILAL